MMNPGRNNSNTPPVSDSIPGRWNQRKRDIGVLVWVSFLAACFGSLLVFAVVEPEQLTNAWLKDSTLAREWGYTLGFGVLWLVSFFAAALAIFMIRTGPQSGHASGQGRRPAARIHDPADNNPGLADENWR